MVTRIFRASSELGTRAKITWRTSVLAIRAMTTKTSATPLVRISNAILPGLQGRKTFDWTINDTDAWAITGPAAERGGAVKAEVVKALMGRTRLMQPNSTRHPPIHAEPTTFSFVSFSSRLSSISDGSTPSSFVDFSARYGAIREEDRVTLYESIMESMGSRVGLIARINLVHDPLVDGEIEAKEDYEQNVSRLPWSSETAERDSRALARENHEKIQRLAPLLKLTDELLQRPLIALSNGQTRRARILTALCNSPNTLVLEEPFTGLDPDSRGFLSALLAEFHSNQAPRIVCVLREQDELPHFVTHVLAVGEQGDVAFQGEIPSGVRTAAELHGTQENCTVGGYEMVRRQAEIQGIGRGDETATPVVAMNDVNIAYKGTKILDSITLTLPPGSRTILVGDNGSGKTILLSLLTGSHPQSFAFDAPTLSLFGQARSASYNATPLLLSRVGQLSPELVNSFPRKGLSRGGLTVGEVVGTGFDGIFSRRPLNEDQHAIVKRLVERFRPVIASTSTEVQGIDALLNAPFISLTPGSQVLLLFLRAIVNSPTLLILDEPFQGMSASQVHYVRSFLDLEPDSPTRRDFNEQQHEAERQWFKRMAWVLVSHFQGEWPLTAARMVRLDGGRLVESI